MVLDVGGTDTTVNRFYVAITHRLRPALNASPLSQREVVDRADLSPTTLKRALRGEHLSERSADSLAAALGHHVHELFVRYTPVEAPAADHATRGDDEETTSLSDRVDAACTVVVLVSLLRTAADSDGSSGLD